MLRSAVYLLLCSLNSKMLKYHRRTNYQRKIAIKIPFYDRNAAKSFFLSGEITHETKNDVLLAKKKFFAKMKMKEWNGVGEGVGNKLEY